MTLPPSPAFETDLITLSNSSKDGDHSSLSDSNYSRTTSSTVPGPGYLAGKAIKALGELTLRGLDRVIIYTRLKVALSRFPHSDLEADSIKGIDKLYDILLELSRPAFYAPDLRNTALLLIGSQIKEGYIRRLVQALGRWHIVELEIFLYGMVQRSVPLVPSVSPFPLVDGYSKSVLPLKVTPVQLVLLMSSLARTSDRACRVVITAGFFDILSSIGEDCFSPPELTDIYHTIFHISTRPEYREEEAGKKAFRFLFLSIIKENFGTQAFRLTQVLAKWDATGRGAFISGLVQQAVHLMNFPPLDFHYSGAVLPMKVTPEKVILFMSRAARVDELGCQAIVNAGYLDILLSVDEGSFSGTELAEIYLAVLDISLRPEYREKEIGKKALRLFVLSIIQEDVLWLAHNLSHMDILRPESFVSGVVEHIARLIGPLRPHHLDTTISLTETPQQIEALTSSIAQWNKSDSQAVALNIPFSVTQKGLPRHSF